MLLWCVAMINPTTWDNGMLENWNSVKEGQIQAYQVKIHFMMSLSHES